MLMIMRSTEAGLSIMNPATLSGTVKMLSEVLRRFGFDTPEAQASMRLKPEYSDCDAPRFWDFESINGSEEDEHRVRTVSVWASSYEQAVTVLYVTYCWE